MRKLFPIAVIAAALVFIVAGAAADSFTLTVVSQTSTTITFTYPQQSGYGYLYSANGAVVSRSNDPTKTQVKFAKANNYEVAAIVKGTTGSYPVAAPPPPNPVCSDGLDNDADGKVDYPADPGCSSATDTDETDPAPGPTTVTPTQFRNACTTGPVSNVTVSGSVALPTNCHATNVTFQGEFTLADGIVLTGCAADGFSGTNGASNWTIDSCQFNGHGTNDNNMIYDSAGKIPKNWHILNSTFQNFYSQNTSNHSEALYIGYSDGGEIRGNHFINNGTTSDIFFTWWGDVADPRISYARNICVSGNTFRNDPGYPDHYYAINFRSEIPLSSGIKTDPNEPGFSTTSPEFNGTC